MESPFLDVSIGYRHLCGIQNDGSLICEGDTSYYGEWPLPEYQQVVAGHFQTCGLLEDSTISCMGIVYDLPPSGAFARIEGRFYSMCAIGFDRSITCWGGVVAATAEPEGEFVQVGVGYYHACAIPTDGSILCWGLNDEGQASPPS